MALTADISAKITANLTSALDLLTSSAPLELVARTELATGTGSGQADMMWTDTRTLTASATEDLDLAGSLTGHLGGTLTFARVKAILVTASSANTNDVQVTRPGAAGVPLFIAAGDGVNVKPGGTLLIVAPNATAYAVTATTADLLTFTNSAGSTSVTYNVVIIGASA